MRKLSLLLTSGLVLLGMMGLQAQSAWADDPEPECEGLPADVQGFHFGTVNDVGGETSLVYGGAALCGTDLRGILIKDVYGAYKEGYILTPGQMDNDPGGGVKVKCANPGGPAQHLQGCEGDDLNSTSYMGSSGVGIVSCLFTGGGGGLGSTCSYSPTFSRLYVQKSPGNPANSHCNDPTVVQCLQSTDFLSLGYGNITVQPCWVLSWCRKAVQGIPDLDPNDNRYVMHIYPMNSLLPGPVYYARIGEPDFNHSTEPDPDDFQLCEFAGSPGTHECGTDPARWIQKNPPVGNYKCSAGKPEGEAVRAIGVGTLKGVPKDKCYSIVWS